MGSCFLFVASDFASARVLFGAGLRFDLSTLEELQHQHGLEDFNHRCAFFKRWEVQRSSVAIAEEASNPTLFLV